LHVTTAPNTAAAAAAAAAANVTEVISGKSQTRDTNDGTDKHEQRNGMIMRTTITKRLSL
jgi:hypothetical protein